MSDSTEFTQSDTYGRLREIEFSGVQGTITILQDSENDRAWIQSDTTLPVRV